MLSARRRPLDIWPGFVDALAALLMVVIFVLLLFTLGQFLLNDALSGKERALTQLEGQVAELTELLSLETTSRQSLEQRLATISATLAATQGNLDQTQQDLLEASEQALALSNDVAALSQLRDALQAEVSSLADALATSRRETAVQAELSTEAQAQVVLLNRQLSALRQQLTEVSSALELAEAENEAAAAEIADLGRRLNLALATEVAQLRDYRSDFFGRLKQALGDNPDLRVEGDRFVFQSELLFDSGSATLGDEGRAQVRSLANVLREIQTQIPADVDWVLRVDGHTDKRPITTALFPSNWELSTARSLAIVKYLTELGISPMRLAATGFG
ncbi:MAG: peptidoglycan -binding protein, partial [Pseudomonadota bacterium]